MKAFLTGSRVYGQPKEDSDIDLVILTTQQEKDKLIELSDFKQVPIRFGKLNLLVCTKEEEYLTWLASRNECYKQACDQEEGLERDVAVTIHIDMGRIFGMNFEGSKVAGVEARVELAEKRLDEKESEEFYL